MDEIYCERRNLYDYGLPRGLLGMSSRELASVTAATDLLELDGHGLEDDDEVLVRAAEGATIAAPLVAGTPYFVKRISDATFKLAATAGGAPIDITTDSDEMFVAIALPYERVMRFWSRFVDSVLPAHLVPLSAPYPELIVGIVAQLSAKTLANLAGHKSETTDAAEQNARTTIKGWAMGQPLRDPKATASANLAVVGKATSASDPRGWGSGTLP